jgi:hypothetical protein
MARSASAAADGSVADELDRRVVDQAAPGRIVRKTAPGEGASQLVEHLAL